jgi:glycosyltransferase involved in cell wall biosynthesis
MERLAIATIATDTPMGAQHYETEVSRRAAAALNATGVPWRIDRVVARSMRSRLAGTVRLPMNATERGGATFRRMVGRVTYPRRSLVHRMSLSLPPAPLEVVTLHDVVAWRFPDEGTPLKRAPAELRAAAVVICVSRNTAADAEAMFGIRNARVVHLGVDARFRDAAPLRRPALDELGIPGRYVLHAGGASTRKNLPALARAWERISNAFPDVTLALAGPEHPRRTELFRGLSRVRLLGRVDGRLVPGLVAGADTVVVPSLYEGFGLPVLEAMAAGTPVVAADTSSIPEVAGDGALLVPPTGEGVADGLASMLSGEVDRDALVARGLRRAAEFTWERCAAEHAAIWNEVVR